MSAWKSLPFGHPFPFPVCVQCHLKDVLPMSVPCMLAVFPHRPHHRLLVRWAHLHQVMLQVSASGVCTQTYGYMCCVEAIDW